MTASGPAYLTCAQTAAHIRQALKRKFSATHPGTTFSVRSSTYSGGASISVKWEDGPTEDAVCAIVDLYQRSRFDGSIDMAYSGQHWLMPDGSVMVARFAGTKSQRGDHEGEANERPSPDAKLVSWGADYVNTYRSSSKQMLGEVIHRLQTKYDLPTLSGLTPDNLWSGAFDHIDLDGVPLYRAAHKILASLDSKDLEAAASPATMDAAA